MARAPKGPKDVEALTHDEARINIPTAEFQSLAERMEQDRPVGPMVLPRARPLAEGETRERDGDLDPQIIWNGAAIRITPEQMAQLAATGRLELGDAQLVWRGKDRQDWSDLVVNAPPLYIQEKIHPKAIIEDLKRRSKAAAPAADTLDLFADFNGLKDAEARTEFYAHDQHWSNRMILGDSLQVMASLAQREALKGQVQCIYFDPPYGIKFNSNWQVSTLSRDVKDGKQTDISREPEQVKAFRDTWKDGIHSYLTYLRDRLTVARELLTPSGSLFVQIGDENVHRVRTLMDEVFGAENCVSQISFSKSSSTNSPSGKTLVVPSTTDFILWYAGDIQKVKYRSLYKSKEEGSSFEQVYRTDSDGQMYTLSDLTAQKPTTVYDYEFRGKTYNPLPRGWRTTKSGALRIEAADRIETVKNSVRYKQYLADYPITPHNNFWSDTGTGSFTEDKVYVVQSGAKTIQRCILMATDPGDLVLDPTCGSGTTAYVAEQWGRRWITVDTSRVALALARTRLMSARYAYYFLKDSPEGRQKEQEVSGRIQGEAATHGDIRQGFVYERAPHVTLKSIANNAEIDVIWEAAQAKLEPLRAELNAAAGTAHEEWEIPREAPGGWPEAARRAHGAWWEGRIARQKAIDASIAKAADVEMLYDRPYVDTGRVRVAGPFTVESLSPHHVIAADDAELGDDLAAAEGRRVRAETALDGDFDKMVLEHLRTAGVQQGAKADRIAFTALTPWPGSYIGAEGRFMEGDGEGAIERRAAIFIGPEFGTLSRTDITAAAREAMDARFDVLICAAFNFDAHASDLAKLGPLPILKAKMNPDLHMAGELKNTGKGNLFVVFGEPDIDILDAPDGEVMVKVNGVDVFDPNTGEVRSNDVKGIAAWFIDTDYNEESFFVRHAYFLGANDPYKALKTALKAEIDEEAWATLYRDVSRPFARPVGNRIAVKVINHFGDEVMKVFRV